MAKGSGRRFSKDTLNFVIAVSAVLISAASFVAAYVQSEAALKQVKAETWPFLQMDTGNTDEAGHSRAIYFRLSNAGVGPARVKEFTLYYDGKEARSVTHAMYHCCVPDGMDRAGFAELLRSEAFTVTSEVPPIIPDGGDILLFNFPFDSTWDDGSAPAKMWKKLDEERRNISAKACYCSLLGDCYQSNLKDDPVEVEACYADDTQ